MEIIIHGKPNAGSHNLTAGINRDFADRFIDDFFRQSDKIKSGDCLIVDAYFWNGMWYSAYTYFVNANIVGVGQDSRDTYFALSVIVQGKYYCLVSEVYSKLKELYSSYVTGRYIKGGRYIVQDFADETVFSGLVSKLNSPGYLVNLEEPIDNKFIQRTERTFNAQYSLIDCDSKAFVQSLRENGRVVVSENVPSKDERLNSINSLQQKLNNAEAMSSAKDEKIKKLEDQINNINQEGNKKYNETKRLNATIAELKSRNNEIENLLSQLRHYLNEIKTKFDQIAAITGVVPSVRQEIPQPSQNKNKHGKNLITANFMLLIVIVILLIICIFRSSNVPLQSSKTNPQEVVNDDKIQASDSTGFKDGTFQSLLISGSKGNNDGQTSDISQDEDCGLSVYSNGVKISSDDSIADGSNLIILATKSNLNYKLYISNAHNDDIKLNEPFKLRAIDSNEVITISYRSSDSINANPKNQICFKIKK